jgi:acyl carrier protein
VQVAEGIRNIIANQLKLAPNEVTDESNLASLGIESLDLLEIVFEIETQFDIHVPYNANEADKLALATVGDVVRTVQAVINGK